MRNRKPTPPKPNSNPTSNPSPSHNRRQQLKQKDDSSMYMKLSNMCQIERYYDTASKLLDRFHTSFNSTPPNLDLAYIYGRRFANFSTQALPTHDYYHNTHNSKYKNLRQENVKAVNQVIGMLEEVVQLMDMEELEKLELKRREEEAIRKIREREEMMRKEEKERKETEDLMRRFQMLDQIGTSSNTSSNDVNDKKDNNDRNENDKEENEMMQDLGMEGLPPPIPYSQVVNDPTPNDNNSPLLPPSYDDATSTTSTSNHTSQRSLQSQSRHQPPSPIQPPPKQKQQTQIPFSQLKHKSHKTYTHLLQTKQIQTFSLGTYQGRIKKANQDSTNGCTVISALVTAHHLSSDGSGIADMTIDTIIDDKAPPLLTKVRRKLGLSEHALIIPSDVHDYMIDCEILKQSQFVEVCGGNLLEVGHVTEFLNFLTLEKVEHEDTNSTNQKDQKKKKNGKDQKMKRNGYAGGNSTSSSSLSSSSSSSSQTKVAATLFFHEHVVSILKVVLSDGTSWYDLVDSLPSLMPHPTDPKGQKQLRGRRIRCKDLKALEGMLHWYACQKFTPGEVEFIDGHEWDDAMCDFDPRVFQAFIWKE